MKGLELENVLRRSPTDRPTATERDTYFISLLSLAFGTALLPSFPPSLHVDGVPYDAADAAADAADSLAAGARSGVRTNIKARDLEDCTGGAT